MTGSARRLQHEDLRESRVQTRGAPWGHPPLSLPPPHRPWEERLTPAEEPLQHSPPISRAGSSGAQESSHVPYIPTAMRASSSLPQSPSAPTAAEQNRQGEAMALQREAGLPIPWPPTWKNFSKTLSRLAEPSSAHFSLASSPVPLEPASASLTLRSAPALAAPVPPSGPLLPGCHPGSAKSTPAASGESGAARHRSC